MKFKISVLDCILLLYLIWVILNRYFIAGTKGFSLHFYELLAVSFVYLVSRSLSTKHIKILVVFVIISGIVQAIHGLLQLYGVISSNHELFMITGGFFNPGPYAGYIAMVWPLALGMYLFRGSFTEVDKKNMFDHKTSNEVTGVSLSTVKIFFNKTKKLLSNRIYTVVPLVCIVSVILVVPSTRSRAAWISILISTFYLVTVRYNLGVIFLKYANNKIKKVFLSIFLVIFIGTCLFGMYQFKKDSANGRLLIWKTTALLIKDNLITGIGYEKFPSQYMDYQAQYLEGKKDWDEAYQAGEVNYAFNTFLKITAELGVIGLSISLLFLFIIFKTKLDTSNVEIKHGFKIAISSILGILTFSLFSYPEYILPIKLGLVILLSITALCLPKWRVFDLGRSRNNVVTTIFQLSLISLGLFILIRAHPLYSKLQIAYNSWSNANYLYQKKLYKDSVKVYNYAYSIFGNNGLFLINYGKALFMAEMHNEAITVLKEAHDCMKNAFLFTTLGDSYKALGHYIKSEKAYKRASYMVPGKFYPKYLLALLYHETGQKYKAIKMANEILEMKAKVPSKAVDQIREEVKKILEEYSVVSSSYNQEIGSRFILIKKEINV